MPTFKNILGLLLIVILLASCQSPSSKSSSPNSLEKTLDSQGKTLNELVREEKKRQAELDLPFRGLDPHKDLSVVAFGSCADQDKPQPLWKTILSQKPDLFLFTGDNIYASRPEQRPFREQYRKLNRNQDYRDAREKVPFLVTWDDHDYGQNDGGFDNPDKEESRREFIRYWSYLKDSIPKEQKGIYHSRIIGKKKNLVQVIMLDTRWDRSNLKKYSPPTTELNSIAMTNSADVSKVLSSDTTTTTQTATPVSSADSTSSIPPELIAGLPEEYIKTPPARVYEEDRDKQKRMLSEEQWRWLESELRKPAQLRIIVSSVQVIANDHHFEKWGNFPLEKERLFQLLKSTKAKNVIFISGDRHMGAIAKAEIKGLGPIYDVTASGLNRPARPGNQLYDTSYVKPGFPNENFGLIKIDWNTQVYNLELLDINGNVISTAQGRF